MDNVNDNTSDDESFKYTTKITRKTHASPTQLANEGDANQPARPQVPSLNLAVTISLEYLYNFWRSLDLTLINHEVELDLSRT